jgi:hypothetical protein
MQAALRSFWVTQVLELPSIGWQLIILGSSLSDSTAFLSSIDTYAIRLLTEPLSYRFEGEQCAFSILAPRAPIYPRRAEIVHGFRRTARS